MSEGKVRGICLGGNVRIPTILTSGANKDIERSIAELMK